ncbi:hypothetical protein F4553_001595 [Allocatelliglobosispora scoriae]|uniref:Uncharacterized protein n=1 Tax=Allocatelliglobosispora scoriae TaxID=643052 RepID=A0A841BLT8_9ACTN|nr:hypothetical protein [Allocatelliglobosispora scoriae]MBB5868216.1 hypothetical protein [Allocatelliglobosispora scoriae]
MSQMLQRVLVAGTAVVLTVGGLSAPTPAIAQAPAASAAACNLRPNPHLAAANEWASCLSVATDLAKAPAIGETVPFTFEVTSQRSLSGIRIEADLPGNLRWVAAPAKLTAAKQTSISPQNYGAIDRASGTLNAAAGSTTRFAGMITAVEAGPAEIRVRALSSLPGSDGAAEDSTFLTVGDGKGTASITGITTAQTGTTAAVPAGTTLTPAKKGRSLTGDKSTESSTQATSCVTGGWFYIDNLGVTRAAVFETVEAWEGGTKLATGSVGSTGRYTLCFTGTHNVYARFVTSNYLWRVRQTGTNNDFAFVSGTVAVADGATVEIGNLQPADTTLMRGLHAFDSAYKAWLWHPGICWDPLDGTCRQLVINWANNSTDGTYYSPGSNDVHLAAADPDAPTTVIHEISHAMMDDIYEDAMPPSPSCNPHSIQGATSAGCAWVEGWAEWFPASVLNDPFYRWPNGASLNLETPTWGTAGWGTGDITEGRVAGALIDISDANNEGYWDVYGEGAPGNVWNTFVNHVANTFAQFWAWRVADGYNVADAGALSSVYQNTIDYTFRNPLGNYAELTRPTPTPHNYGYNTGSNYWSVVAVRSTGADYDLQLFDDRAQTVNLGTSTFGGTTIDFVAVDSNRRPLGDYYPNAFAYSGTGNYQVELAQGFDVLGAATSQAIAMGTNDVVTVRDVSLTAGVPVTFTVSGAGDAELFLMSSDAATPATWVRGRPSAVATASAAGAGGTETFTFTPTVTQWYGLVLINKAGSGTYTLSRS